MNTFCQKIIRSNLATSVLLNGIFLLLYIILSSCKFPSMDDFFMSTILTGGYGAEYDVHLFFVNVVYGFFLKPFYFFFPNVGWYYIFEVVEVFAAFTMLTYIIVSRFGMKLGAMLSTLLLVCLSPSFYFQVSFTQNASLLAAVGFLLVAFAKPNQKKFLLLGMLFAIAGFVMRKDAFMLGIPCLGMLLLFKWIYARKFPLTNVICALACLLFAFALYHFDKSFYQEGDYRYYAEYQAPRAVFGDGRFYDRDATLDEIEERGLYGNDFSMLTNWFFYDTENLTKDSLQKYLEIVDRNRFDVVQTKMPLAIGRELSRNIQDTRTWPWIALCFFSLMFIPRKLRFAPWVSLAYVICAYSYLLMKNRVVPHVESGIWIYAMIPMIPLFSSDCLKTLERRMNFYKSFAILSLSLYAVGYWGVPNLLKTTLFQDEPDERWNAFLEYERSNPDKVFVFEFTAYKEFGRHFNKGYKSVEPGRFNHIIPLGYWNVHFPGMTRALKEGGLENPMHTLANANVFVVQYGDPTNLLDYCKFHFNQQLNYDNLSWTNLKGKEVLGFEVSKYFIEGE